MTVNLIKEANFEFDETKCKAVDAEVFNMLVEPRELTDENQKLPDVMFFKDKDEYRERAGLYEIDTEKPIFLNDKKQVFCYLKER